MQRTDAPPPEGSAPPSRIGWHIAMLIIRPAAAGMAGWSLYAVARHYGVPELLAIGASLVFDGIALACLYQASEAVRAGRSAAAPILATLALAGTSVYLNVVHADLINGGTPAAMLFATPTVGLLVSSGLAWSSTRAAARAARGEAPMRLPAYGLWGWTLANEEARKAVKARAVAHVTSSRPPTAAQVPRDRSARTALREHLATMDPAEAIEITAASQPSLAPAEVAELLATYGITVDALQVALVLGRTAAPSVRLDRMPTPPEPVPLPTGQPAAITKTVMRADTPADMPQVSGLPLSDAIVSIHRQLTGDATPKTVVQHLALQGRATDTAYVRTALGRALTKAMEEAAKEQARRAEAERSNGTGFYP